MKKMAIARALWRGAVLLAATAKAVGVYQWSVEVPEIVSKETGEHLRAYLWIPETCEKVRGVVVGNDNMLEDTLFAHEDFRRELASADIAVVFVQSGFQGFNTKCDAEDAKVVLSHFRVTLPPDNASPPIKGWRERTAGCRIVL